MKYKIKTLTISTDIVQDMQSDKVAGKIFPEFIRIILSEMQDDTVIILTDGIGNELERSTVRELRKSKDN